MSKKARAAEGPAASARAAGAYRGPGLALVIAVVVVLAFGFLGTRGLTEPDEGRYVRAALEMVDTGRVLVPTLGGAPHLTKPPLAYWASAAGLALLGRNEWGARVFLGVVFVAQALVVLALGSRLGGAPFGRAAALVHATMLMPLVGASVVTTDALLALWSAAAVACFVEARHRERENAGGRRAWLVAMWAALGLAFLAKGPPALLPLAVAAAVTLASPGGASRWRALAGLAPPAGLAVFALVGLGWYALLGARDPAVLGALVREEVFGRVFGEAHGRNTAWYKPLTMYAPGILLGALPWSAAWPLFAARALRRRDSRRAGGLDGDGRRLAWTWLLLPLAVLCAARSRQMLYLLPLFAPLALLTTSGLARHLPRRGGDGGPAPWRPWLSGVALGATAALLALRVFAAETPSPRDARRVADFVREHAVAGETRIVMATPRFHGLALYLDVPLRVARADEPRPDAPAGRTLYVAREGAVGPLATLFAEPPPACRVVDGPQDLVLAVCSGKADGSGAGRTLSPRRRTAGRSPPRGARAGTPRASS